MHVLWIVPDYYSFLREEMIELADHVDRLSVISQEPADFSQRIRCVDVERDKWSFTRVVGRSRHLVEAISNGGCPRHVSDWPKFRRLARHNEVIRDYVRREGVDVLHSHFAAPEGTAACHGASGRPVVLTLRGVDILTVSDIGYGFLLDDYYRRNLSAAFQNVDVVTAASTLSFDSALAAGAERAKLRLIPNGVDTSRFSADPSKGRAVRDRLGIEDRPLVLGVGNLNPGKAFKNLIDCVGLVRNNHPDVCVAIVGDGPESPALALQAEARLSPNSFFLPGRVSRDEINRYFSAATVFVHPSRSEGFGNVVLEAMAAGCPVVATRTGAAADLIVDGENGRLVEVDDIDGLAAAVSSVLASAEARRLMAARAAEQVRKDFSLEARAAAFVRIYKEVLDRKDKQKGLVRG